MKVEEPPILSYSARMEEIVLVCIKQGVSSLSFVWSLNRYEGNNKHAAGEFLTNFDVDKENQGTKIQIRAL